MIEDFIAYQKTNRGLSETTLKEYFKDLKEFSKWLDESNSGKSVTTATQHETTAYVTAMAERGLKPTTIRRRMSAIRTFSRWLMMSEFRTDDYARYTQTPKVREQLPKLADVDMVRHYLEAPCLHAEEKILKAITALILTTGLRISEALSIDTKDIDKEHHTIKVTGKGGKERIVSYTEETGSYLNKMLGKRRGVIFAGWSALDIRTLMAHYIRKDGRGIHPHQLRHTFASIMVEGGCELPTLARILGHNDITTTQRYIHVSDRSAKQAVLQFAPSLA